MKEENERNEQANQMRDKDALKNGRYFTNEVQNEWTLQTIQMVQINDRRAEEQYERINGKNDKRYEQIKEQYKRIIHLIN